jgi:hypothetical protein
MISARRPPFFLSGLLACVLLGFAPEARPEGVTYVERGSTWKYFRGLSEASSPDTAAWRQLSFDDDAWANGPAPFGYSDGPFGTDLSLLTPPMRNNYSTLFLRQRFEVPDPESVLEPKISADYDDGFIVWINGIELLRVNVPGQPGDPVAYNGFATLEHESGTYEEFFLPEPADYLVAGSNVIAVQVFNVTLTSSDLKLDLDLFDPLGPDRTPPAVSLLVPAAGVTVRTLERIEVTFSEAVTGVTAGALRINGSPASTVTGAGRGPYLFSFPQPAAGTVSVSWAAGHGITDLATPPNAFAGGSWSYTLDPGAPLAEVVINEFVAASGGGLLDDDGEASDWIEIFNRGDFAVNLGGYSLSDDEEELGKWTFPPLSLGAGQHLVVFASGKDRRRADRPLHTSFKLSAGGEHLGLYSAESPRRALSAFTPRYPPQRSGFSYGLGVDGSYGYFTLPTPGAPNGAATPFTGFAGDPHFSAVRGFYEAPVTVELLSATPGASIYFTLDGSEPGPGNGMVYTGALTVAGQPRRAVVTLRAAAYKSSFLPSNVVTHTYIFPDHVLAQPANPDGFPAAWGTQPADYAMDARVVGDPAYTPLAREGLVSIPSVSIVTHVNDLFQASTGIYANPSREGTAWERAVSAEIIYPGGEPSLQVDCGLRIQGGSSTSGWKALKVSMRLLFKDDYGASKLVAPLFAGSPVERFDTLVLDAHLNLTWNHPDHGQRVRSQYVRDQYISDLQLATGWPAPQGIFVNLYLNGLYWGLYGLHERPDHSFAAEHFGGNKAEYDAIRHVGSEIVSGDGVAWNAMMALARGGLTTIAQYEALQQYLDVQNLIDYMLVNIWAGNDDWPRHNWYAARRRQPGAAYRFFSWDAEHVLKNVNINQTGVSNTNSPAELYNRLRANPEFRLLFADHVQRHFSPGGVFYVDPARSSWNPDHPERNLPAARYMRRIEEIDPAIVLESARWGDVRRPAQPYTRNVEWRAELEWLLNQYFPLRSNAVLDQLRTAGLYPAVGAPVFSLPSGVIEPGAVLAMTLPAGTTGAIHYTTDGSDPRLYGSGLVSPAARVYGSPFALSGYTHVKARTLSGGNWSALSEATYRLDIPLDALRISEIMYNPPLGRDHEFIELTNIGEETLDLSGVRFTRGIDYVFPAGAGLAPGAHVVLVSHPAAFASSYPGVPIAGSYRGNLDNAGETLEISDPTGAVVLSMKYDDEGFWPIGPDGFGWSLVIIDPLGDPSSPENWRASSAPGGSPGREDPPAPHGAVVISEVLGRGALPLEAAIEIQNLSGSPVAVGGWFLSDSREGPNSLRKFRIPDGTLLPAGGHAVFYENQFNPAPGVFPSFAPARAGGALYLSAANASGNLTGHIAGFELQASKANVSFGRITTSLGPDLSPLSARSFGVDEPASVEEFRGGRGAPNAPPLVGPLVLSEIHYHPASGGVEFVEIHNISDSAVSLYPASQGRGWRLSGLLDSTLTGPFEFIPGTVIEAGGYLLLVPIEPASFRSIYGVPAEVPIAGPYGGVLDNGGELLMLLEPERLPGGELIYIPVDQVRYDDDPPWPAAPDGGGPSLERVIAGDYGNDPFNWQPSLIAGGTPGRANSVSPPLDNLPPLASFTALPLSGPAPLAVTFDASSSSDPDGKIAAYEWSFGDGGTAGGPRVSYTFHSPGIHAVTLRVRDDRGARASATVFITVEALPPAALQVPGDCNLDGRVDISDGICILAHLFLGGRPLPCQGGISEGGNKLLLNVDGDRDVNLTDAIFLLRYLFQGGAPPALGEKCIPMEGCPASCLR